MPVTIRGLLEEMRDLSRLAEYPDPAYREAQFSSYDRASKEPGTPEWFANKDHSQYLRSEEREGRTERVLMDASGPGAIVRIWTASAAKGGTIRIYLDGAARPALEHDLRDLLEGKDPCFPVPLAGWRGAGWTLYYPFPYRSRCIVTATAVPAFYYQVNYRSYAPGTEVEPFTLERAEAARGKAAEVAASLASPADPSVSRCERTPLDVTIGSGETRELARLSGPRAIRLIKLAPLANPDLSASDWRYEGLRRCVLRIRFDGEGEPAVEAPLGDFFGSAPGVNAYDSLPLSVEPDGSMTCRWLMPFERSATLELRSFHGDPVRVTGSLYTDSYDWSERSLHFHARFRAERGIPTQPERDWRFLDASGKGRYVGNMLTIANPSQLWWGEGDEKVYVDGESFPSTFGTGTEDYYGYAYGSTDRFRHAYHNQPLCDEPGSFGLVCVNRFHVLDDIPFAKSVRFDMEVWHWDRRICIDYATTVYWYAGPRSRSTFEELTGANTPVIYRPVPFRIPGVIEAEDVESRASAGRSWLDVAGIEYSGGHVSMWKGMKPGDTKTFKLPVPRPGRYRLIGRFDSDPGHGIHTFAPSRGSYDLAVEGTAGPAGLDLSSAGKEHPEEVDLGLYELRAGMAEVVFTCRSEPAEGQDNILAVDCFRLVPMR